MCAGTDAPNLGAMTARPRAHGDLAECGDWTRSEPSRERSFMKHEHSYRSLVGRKGARHSRRLAHAPGLAAALLAAVCMFVVFSASSGAAAGSGNSPMSRAWSNATGLQHLHCRTAPIRVPIAARRTKIQGALTQMVEEGAPGAVVAFRDGSRTLRLARGFADTARKTPMSVNDRFRIGSV